VTGNTSRREGRMERGSVSSHSQMLAFGPQGFTRDTGPAGALYDEGVGTRRAAARAGGLWGIAEDIAKKAAKAVVNTVTRYNRPAFARARAGGAYSLGPDSADIDPEKVGIYRSVLTGKYPVEEADQSFLQKITGKFGRYVYGANWGGRLFVDRILKRKSPEQTYATYLHEAGHTANPELDDEAVEAVSKSYALHLARNDPSGKVRQRALQAYRGLGKAGMYSETAGFMETIIPNAFRRGSYATALA
jgi:hypothetical protein